MLRTSPWHFTSWWVLGCLVFGGVVAGPNHVDARDPAKIQAALDKKISVEFVETPLREAAQFLAESGQINVRLNARSLANAGVAPDAPCTLRLRELSLRSVLNRLASEFQIEWIVRPWGIELVDSEATSVSVVTRAIDVSDLVPADDRKRGPSDREDLLEELTAVLQMAALPRDGWIDDGGIGRLDIDSSGVLVVSSTSRTVGRIEQLLKNVRDAMKMNGAKELRDGLAVSLPAPNKAEKAILDALEQPTEVEFEGVSLRDVVNHLTEQLKIPIQLDRRALEAYGIDPDSPVSVRLKDATAGEVLHEVLADFELTTVIRDEVLLVTTRDEGEAAPEMRVYPVGDFAPTERRDIARDLWDELARRIVRHAGSPTPGWEDDGGTGKLRVLPIAKSLVISTTADVHDQIADLLGQLRRVRGDRPVSVPDQPRTVTRVYELNALLGEDADGLTPAQITEWLTTEIQGSWDKSGTAIRVVGKKVQVRQTTDLIRKLDRHVHYRAETAYHSGGFF